MVGVYQRESNERKKDSIRAATNSRLSFSLLYFQESITQQPAMRKLFTLKTNEKYRFLTTRLWQSREERIYYIQKTDFNYQ